MVKLIFGSLFWARQPPVDQDRIHKVAHNDALQSVGLLWMSDQLVAETTHNTHNRQISIPQVGFEPTISAGEGP